MNVIFDRVFLTLSVLNSRINVGETAPVGVAGFYEYDLSPWNGDFTLNDTLTKNEVGLYEFTGGFFHRPKLQFDGFSEQLDFDNLGPSKPDAVLRSRESQCWIRGSDSLDRKISSSIRQHFKETSL